MIGLTLSIGFVRRSRRWRSGCPGYAAGLGLGHVAEQEADREVRLQSAVHHGAQVRAEVGVGLGLGLLGLDAQVLLGLLQAFVGGLVERLVVESTGVGNDAAHVVGVFRPGCRWRPARQAERRSRSGQGGCAEHCGRTPVPRLNAQRSLQFSSVKDVSPRQQFNGRFARLCGALPCPPRGTTPPAGTQLMSLHSGPPANGWRDVGLAGIVRKLFTFE